MRYIKILIISIFVLSISSPSQAQRGANKPDKKAPTVPTNLSASAISPTEIHLSWTASTDNIGIKDYRLENCWGSGCTNFGQIAILTSTSFSDTGLSPNTLYRYRARASNVTGNLSVYSNISLGKQ